MLPAGALTSELLFPMSNLGITNATPLQPHSYHVKKFPQPHLSVNDRENSHQDSNVRRPPTSSQSSFMFGSIAHPKQTTDVSRQGTVEIVYTNLTGLTDKQLEPEHVRASASNHEVKDEYIICIKAILCVGKKNINARSIPVIKNVRVNPGLRLCLLPHEVNLFIFLFFFLTLLIFLLLSTIVIGLRPNGYNPQQYFRYLSLFLANRYVKNMESKCNLKVSVRMRTETFSSMVLNFPFRDTTLCCD